MLHAEHAKSGNVLGGTMPVPQDKLTEVKAYDGKSSEIERSGNEGPPCPKISNSRRNALSHSR